MEIFRQVKHAHLLWDVYKPSKSLEQYESVENLVNVYKFGESVIMGDKRYTKPSLEAVESEFGASWRSTSQVSEFNSTNVDLHSICSRLGRLGNDSAKFPNG